MANTCLWAVHAQHEGASFPYILHPYFPFFLYLDYQSFHFSRGWGQHVSFQTLHNSASLRRMLWFCFGMQNSPLFPWKYSSLSHAISRCVMSGRAATDSRLRANKSWHVLFTQLWADPLHIVTLVYAAVNAVHYLRHCLRMPAISSTWLCQR